MYALLLFAGNVIVACLVILFYILGSKISKKEN